MPIEFDDRAVKLYGNNERLLQFYDDNRVLRAEIYLTEDNRLNIGSLQVGGGNGAGESTDLSDVGFLTVAGSPLLDQERILTAGDGITLTDEGGGNNLTIDLQTPGTLSASSPNEASGSHTHAITASSNPGAAASLLKSTASGGLTLESITIDTITVDGSTISATGDLTLNPAGSDVLLTSADRIGTDNFVSGLTGWRIDYDGSADFRDLTADELRVKAFIADIEQALAGGQIVSKSVAILSRDFQVPVVENVAGVDTATDRFYISGDFTAAIDDGQTFAVSGSTGNDGAWTVDHTVYSSPFTQIYVTGDITDSTADGEIRFRRTIWVEDLPGFADTAVFGSADWLRLRVIDRSGGGLVVADVWGQVTGYTDRAGGEQTWLFTGRDDGGVAGDTVYAGALAIDYGASGDGYWEVTALGSNVPYSQIVTWATDPTVSGNHTLRSRLGNLDGVTDATFPTIGGWGLYSDNAYLKGDLVAAAGEVTINDDGITVTPTGTFTYDHGYKIGTSSEPDMLRIWMSELGGATNSRRARMELVADDRGDTAYVWLEIDDDGLGLVTLEDDLYVNNDARVNGGLEIGSDINPISTTSGLLIRNGDLTVDTDTLHVDSTASRVGIGTATPGRQVDIEGNAADYLLEVFNDGNASTRNGIYIRAGQDLNPSHTAIRFDDGDGTQIGSIAGDGSGGINYNQASDERRKQEIENLVGALDAVRAVQPIRYRGLGASPERPKVTGVSAQELQTAMPDAVHYDAEQDVYQVAYNKVVPYLIGAIRELETRLAAVEAV